MKARSLQQNACAEVVLSAIATVWTLATENAQFETGLAFGILKCLPMGFIRTLHANHPMANQGKQPSLHCFYIRPCQKALVWA